MSFCNDKGIPHSVFLEWDPEDRAKAMAQVMHEGERCSLCGTAPWEWEENRYAYEPEEHMCHGCYLKQSYNESLGKTLPGTTVELVRVTSQRRAQQIVTLEKRKRMLKGE